MNEGVMTEVNSFHGPQRRRSPRLGSPQAAPLGSDNKKALGVKRFITVRKIAPRKTAAPSEHNKENTPNRTEQHDQQKKPKVSTPDPVPERRPPSSSAGRKKQQEAAMPSPILPASPPASSRTQQPAADPEDAVWSQKVRRSYTRLSDRSLHSPDSREALFGFERLQTPKVVCRLTEQSRTNLEASGSSFTSLLEAEECCPEPDPNIPGVAVVKERRRRRKVQKIDAEELDALADRMNAEFREAEEFELVVE
ncbi:sororin [Kryptolebias marmoratus]|uniref:sororin n=1 Tax=Kryptolebias marmoratus TaxID=37003 RepID=UPI0007F8ADA6|nr:sororin [Kryptolebias marmoratus]